MAIATGFGKGFKGKIQNIVFRTVGDKTYVSLIPTRQSKRTAKRKETALQRLKRDSFREASKQARIILSDPALRAHYKKVAIRRGLSNPRIALISDILNNKPLVTSPEQVKVSTLRLAANATHLRPVKDKVLKFLSNLIQLATGKR
jgi:hypothetical protein